MAMRWFRRKSFSLRDVREELDGHLDAINENTQEVLENRAMILELQERFCKLLDRVHELELGRGLRFDVPPQVLLSLREQEVFVLLYTAASSVRYSSVSRTLSLPLAQVHALVRSLVQKGIPVVSSHDDEGELRMQLESWFIEHQSKRNVVPIDGIVMQQFNRYHQLSLLE